MSKLNNDEPSLEKIDDYNGKESKEKRNTVRVVIIFCLVVGAFMAYLKSSAVTNDNSITNEKQEIPSNK